MDKNSTKWKNLPWANTPLKCFLIFRPAGLVVGVKEASKEKEIISINDIHFEPADAVVANEPECNSKSEIILDLDEIMERRNAVRDSWDAQKERLRRYGLGDAPDPLTIPCVHFDNIEESRLHDMMTTSSVGDPTNYEWRNKNGIVTGAKLTKEEVLRIRENKENYSEKQWACLFNVKPETIRNVITRQTWRDV